ncbi:MAG TPA: peptidoglycan DD-metalloendopeptidase family protein [Anaerolineales bacterium]|nr:peptidoglycan DD-metalloendopeptidase family protein [Anaerolineales bacterium]
MKNILENIRTFLQRFKRQPKSESSAQVNVADATPRVKGKADRFTIISWVFTILIVVTLLVSTILYKNSRPSTIIQSPLPTAESGAGQPQGGVPVAGSGGSGTSSILRELQLKTNIPERPRYESVIYRVTRGDAMLSIADEYKIKSETILYVNKQLEDNPHNLKPGMELTIPPVDGLYYEWQDGDTFETVAEKFDTTPEEIINFPGNRVDLTDPKIEPGTLAMIPGGSRELRNWAADLQTAGRSNNGSTGTSDFGGNACGGGPVSSGLGWPADDHSLSGNPYGPGHLGIDISAPEGSNVYAAGNGVVTMAQGGYNYGYGNVIQIDHGNGYVTVYAHLSQINIGVCTPVGQGTLIGYSGNTGNSFGAHLHFEIRIGGTNVNPYDIVQ